MVGMVRKLVLISTCAAALTPVEAMAQVSGDPQPSAPQPTTQEPTEPEAAEIVVTANRREESLLDVPLSVSAFSQESLDKQGVRNVRDLARISPGVSLEKGPSASTRIAIRGISSDIGAGTVGIYINDTPIQVRTLGLGLNATNPYPAVFDLARVEVLRGPQGTLFGAGSEGGAIRFITPEPGLAQYSGYARAELGFTEGGDPSYEAGAAVGGPLIQDRLGFRLSGYHRKDGGWIDRVDPVTMSLVDKNANDVETTVINGSLRVAVNEDFSITPAIYYQKMSSNSNDTFWRNLSNPSGGRFFNGQSISEPRSDRFILYSLSAQYDVGFAEIISETSYLDRHARTIDDNTDFIPEILRQNFLLGHTTGAITTNTLRNTQNAFTQEVRVQSNDTGPLKWVVGGFYQKTRQSADQSVSSPNIDALTIAAFGRPLQALLGRPALQPGSVVIVANDKSTDELLAGFAQIDYEIFSNFTATAGVRISRTTFRGSNVQDGPFNGGRTSAQLSQSETPVTPKFGVSYKPSDALLLYANAAKGFRPGGGNVPVPQVICANELAALGFTTTPPSFSSDSVWSYDVGAKGRVSRGVRFDASAFYIKWDQIQSKIFLQCAQNFTTNLGSATSKGFDLHVTVEPVTGLTLDAAVAYTHATYDKTILGGPLPAGGRAVLIAEGDRLRVHPWTVNVSVEYETPLSLAQDLVGYLRADYNYASSYPDITARFEPLNAREATHIANLRAGVRKGDIDFSLFVNNLTDSTDRLFTRRANAASPLFKDATFRPRTFGATVAYRY